MDPYGAGAHTNQAVTIQMAVLGLNSRLEDLQCHQEPTARPLGQIDPAAVSRLPNTLCENHLNYSV